MCRPMTWTFFLLSLEANPEKFNSRFRNKMFYAGVSVWRISGHAFIAALASAGAQAWPQLLSTSSTHSSELHGPSCTPKLSPPRSWRGAGERLQPWESQFLFGCDCCWQYSLLSGLRYSCCLDLLPLLFLFSGSRTVNPGRTSPEL